MKLGLGDTALRLGVLEWMKVSSMNNVRLGSSYVFGALYGFLLDEFDVHWTQDICFSTDLSELLKDAAGITELTPFNELDFEQYGLSAISESELERAKEIDAIIDTIRRAYYEQPRLRIDVSGEYFGDIHAVRVPELGILFYGDFVFSGVFGTVTFSEGSLLMAGNGYEIPAGSIDINGNRVTGINWEFVVNDGYGIWKQANGNFEVRSVLS